MKVEFYVHSLLYSHSHHYLTEFIYTMRNRNENDAMSVRAISGTSVVLLGLDIKRTTIELHELMAQISLELPSRLAPSKKPTSMFIGFSITRIDLETGESLSLNDGGRPIQKLLWGDYDCEPGRNYEVSRLCHLHRRE